MLASQEVYQLCLHVQSLSSVLLSSPSFINLSLGRKNFQLAEITPGLMPP